MRLNVRESLTDKLIVLEGRNQESANLDFLRTIAVGLVILDHFCTFFGNVGAWFFDPTRVGKLGVILFFVHTSLVLMFSLERQVRAGGTRSLFSKFYLRRFFRLYPLSVLTVLTIFTFEIPAWGLNSWHLEGNFRGWDQLAANLLLVQNFLKKGDILGPLWSLAFEMQMYLVLPAIFLWIHQKKRTQLPSFLWGLCAVFAATFLSRFDRINLELTYFAIPEWLVYGACFLPGVICYQNWQQTRPTIPFWGLPLLLGALTWLFSHATQGSAGFAVFAFATGIALPHFKELTHPALKKFSAQVARYSYGLYLFHYLSLSIPFVMLKDWPVPAQWMLFSALLVGLPVILYHWVEAPCIELGRRMAKARTYAMTPTAIFPKRLGKKPRLASPKRSAS